MIIEADSDFPRNKKWIFPFLNDLDVKMDLGSKPYVITSSPPSASKKTARCFLLPPLDLDQKGGSTVFGIKPLAILLC